MTTGSRTIGNSDSQYYWQKTWSGVNGKSVQNPLAAPRIYRVVDKVIPGQVYFVPRYSLRNNEEAVIASSGATALIKVVVPAKYSYRMVTRYSRVRLTESWNNYEVTGSTGTQDRGVGPLLKYNIGFGNGMDTLLVWSNNDELQLLSKLSDAVRGHSFDLGVALGEGRQTMTLLLDTLYRVTGAVRAIKRGRIDHALRCLGAVPRKEHTPEFLKRRHDVKQFRQGFSGNIALSSPNELKAAAISSMWLEIQYGWRPLIDDVYESMKAYSAITDKARTARIIVSSPKKRRELYSTEANKCTRWEKETYSKRIVCELTEMMTFSRNLGLADPSATLWEITPFSFVADWFIPVGTYLSNLACIPYLQGRFLIQEKRINETQAKGIAVLPYNAYKNARLNHRRVWYRRTFTTSLSVPHPQFKSLRDALSVRHVENAIALLHQLVKLH